MEMKGFSSKFSEYHSDLHLAKAKEHNNSNNKDRDISLTVNNDDPSSQNQSEILKILLFQENKLFSFGRAMSLFYSPSLQMFSQDKNYNF